MRQERSSKRCPNCIDSELKRSVSDLYTVSVTHPSGTLVLSLEPRYRLNTWNTEFQSVSDTMTFVPVLPVCKTASRKSGFSSLGDVSRLSNGTITAWTLYAMAL